jgi:hypothetical protein
MGNPYQRRGVFGCRNPYRVGSRSKSGKAPRLTKSEVMTGSRIRGIPHNDPKPGRVEFHARTRVELAPVAKVEIPEWVPVSGNRLRWASRWTVNDYKRTSYDHVALAMRQAGRAREEACPKTFRVVRLTRFCRRRVRDAGNLSEGWKFVLDALTWTHDGGWGLIADDDMTWCEVLYEQVSGAERMGYVGSLVEVWELRWKGSSQSRSKPRA